MSLLKYHYSVFLKSQKFWLLSNGFTIDYVSTGIPVYGKGGKAICLAELGLQNLSIKIGHIFGLCCHLLDLSVHGFTINFKYLDVVHFDQQTGAPHAVCWSKSLFLR